VVVQGRADPQREILDVESVAGHLLPAGGVFEFLAGHRRELFPDELFADLFPSRRGRPSIPADVVASVIVLQTLHGLSDSEAVEAVTFDLRWKAACGLAVTAPGFHPTVLTYWRRRLAASARPRRIFEVVGQVVAQTGVLAGKTRRALDSTVLDDAVATQDTVTQLIAAIRRVARDVPGAAAVIAEHCSGLITGCALTPAAGAQHSDAAVGIELLTDEPDPIQVLGDSAYGTGELLAAAAAGGHTAIIKPWPLRPAVDGGFTLDDFTVDEAAATVTCPNGLTARITRTRKVIFGARCHGCPLRARCTSSTRGRKLALHPHDALHRAHRVRAQDPEFQAVYREHRPMVERSISWLVAGRNRRLRFVGTRRNDLWLHHRAAALNLRRLLALGLTRTGGTWAVSTA
jgi:hypothetical protein